MHPNNTSTTLSSPPSFFSLLPWFITFGLEAIVIVAGNLITVLAFATKKTAKKTKFLLLINLSIADLLVGAIPLPLYVAYLGGKLSFWEIYWSKSLEVALFAVDVLLGFASVTTLTVISLERVYATVVPVSYRGLKPRSYWFSLVFIWSIASFTAGVCLASNYVLRSFEIATYVSMSLLSVLCLVISVSYLTIWRRIKFKRRNLRKGTNEYENKLALTLFIVTVTSLAAWLPFVIANVLFLFSSLHFSLEFLYFSKVLHYGNSFVNPIVYSFRMPEFRKSVARMFSLRLSETRLQEHQLSNLYTAATEGGHDTFRSNLEAPLDHLVKDSIGRRTAVAWGKAKNQEMSLLMDEGV